jgi:hypothetical protein
VKDQDMGDQTTMPPDRALAINAALVAAFMVRDGLRDGPAPDVTWFSPRDAEEASTMMQDSDLGRRKNADGSTTFSCFVAPTRVRSLYAWALATWADCGREAATDV